MKPIVGLEFSAARIRAVTVSRVLHRPLRRFDIPWKPDSIDAAVQLLQEHLGGVSAIGIAVGMQFLFPKHIKLPPVSAAEKRRMISLEPERFFPVSTPLLVSTAADRDLVLGADASAVEGWVTALERWAPVQNLEGSPSSFARAGRSLKFGDGVYEIASGDDDRGYAELRAGRLISARRARASASDSSAREIPSSAGIPGAFMAAMGAALGVNDSPDEMLVSDERHARLRSSRVQSLVFVSLLAIASLSFVLFSAAQSRERYLERIDAATAALRPRAATAASLQGRLELMGVASSAARNAQSAADPLAVITILSRRLPRDAVVMTTRGVAGDWQITGTAKDAAGIIPALDADPALENVRFLAGTSRFTEDRRSYETFSIGFRVRPSAQ